MVRERLAQRETLVSAMRGYGWVVEEVSVHRKLVVALSVADNVKSGRHTVLFAVVD